MGGLEQIGMNITAFEYEDSIVVVDCGLAFPEDDMLGIDLVIPDVSYLKDNASKVKGFVITHGHEDHIGALPYVLKEINLPIYTTKLTMGIIENKLKELLPDANVYPTCTNFVFLSHEDAEKIFRGLLKKGIAIRYFPTDRLRITASYDSEIEELCTAISEILH